MTTFRRMLALAVGAALVAVLLACSAAEADTITFDYTAGGQDTSLVSYAPRNNYGSSTVLWQWNRPSREIQSLIQFSDIFGNNPGEIPLGSTITNALLNVYIWNGSTAARKLYQLTTGWDAGNATWNSFGGGVTVANQTTGSPVASYTQSGTGWLSIDVTSSLQAWANGQANYGWAIFSDFANTNDWSGIYSMNSSVNFRSTLTVAYDSPVAGAPEPGTLLLLGSGLAGVLGWRARCRRKA
ncbi:MAG: DNRLRE domain-containing protein [Proteobacteria bacterium]|nr:DNRLRE domain-containing protein [Pseudomonadota bacterium]MBU1451046.1 DNRLRE domain-containing protein [Pseudomonadota bacterium]MBU2468075.1 DNRLRE domain-containing protein [Pseudomonadota bacterium]MBU2517663.1 DNRLRE domain-containing protein [Pseudomonadota bacterium]